MRNQLDRFHAGIESQTGRDATGVFGLAHYGAASPLVRRRIVEAIRPLPLKVRLGYIHCMTVKRTKSVSLEELWEYEAKHPVVFASPRALAEARLIADLGRRKHRRRGNRGYGTHTSSHRKSSAA